MDKPFIFMLISLLLVSGCTVPIEKEQVVQETDYQIDGPEKTLEHNLSNKLLDQKQTGQNNEITPLKNRYPTTEFIGEGNLADLKSCGDTKILFDRFPVNLEGLAVITPLGSVGSTAHIIPTPHLFLRPRRTGQNEAYTIETSVFAPADMRIYLMSSVEDVSKTKKFETDYALFFSPCKEAVGYFDHVWDVPEEIIRQYESAPELLCNEYTLIYPHGPIDWKFCKKRVAIDVKAGDYLGKTGGEGKADVFDFALFDYRNERHPYKNVEEWRNIGNTFEEAFYVTCPLNYFPETVRAAAEKLLGADGKKRSVKPLCGEVFQDIDGTAQGVWFRDSPEHSPGSRYLSLVHDAVDPTIPVFVIGEGLESISYGDYFYAVKKEGLVNRDFSEVLPGKVYCFDALSTRISNKVSGKILLELSSSRNLKLEKQEGVCESGPWSFSGKENVFTR